MPGPEAYEIGAESRAEYESIGEARGVRSVRVEAFAGRHSLDIDRTALLVSELEERPLLPVTTSMSRGQVLPSRCSTC